MKRLGVRVGEKYGKSTSQTSEFLRL